MAAGKLVETGGVNFPLWQIAWKISAHDGGYVFSKHVIFIRVPHRKFRRVPESRNPFAAAKYTRILHRFGWVSKPSAPLLWGYANGRRECGKDLVSVDSVD